MRTEFHLLLFHMHRLVEVGCLSKLSSMTSHITIDFQFFQQSSNAFLAKMEFRNLTVKQLRKTVTTTPVTQ